ncbi:MAG: dihydrofolate reductase [Clostridia bacterium]|nr:dihydrofolate reductase [Clostridia bacterium]
MIALIVARAENGVIGNKGRIPWRIQGEQRRFRELTLGNTVIMGRRTYEEIGHPLPGRDTVVVSSTRRFEGENCRTARSLGEALSMCHRGDAYVCGGAALYREALNLVDVMYITEIHAAYEGDTYFPEFDETAFQKLQTNTVEGEVSYTYVTYWRKKD